MVEGYGHEFELAENKQIPCKLIKLNSFEQSIQEIQEIFMLLMNLNIMNMQRNMFLIMQPKVQEQVKGEGCRILIDKKVIFPKITFFNQKMKNLQSKWQMLI